MNTTTQPTILVIEDDTALLSAISAKLSRSGFQIITARSVESAFTQEFIPTISTTLSGDTIEKTLEHLNQLEKVNAIWLDHNLIGDEDGLDFIVKLKANGGTWSTMPIFVVSNSANPELRDTYTELDVQRYYLKAEHRLEDIVTDIATTLKYAPTTQTGYEPIVQTVPRIGNTL